MSKCACANCENFGGAGCKTCLGAICSTCIVNNNGSMLCSKCYLGDGINMKLVSSVAACCLGIGYSQPGFPLPSDVELVELVLKPKPKPVSESN